MNHDYLTAAAKSLAALRDDMTILVDRISTKKAEIEQLRTAPASRADVLAGIEALFAQRSAEYDAAFSHQVNRLTANAMSMDRVDGVFFATAAPAGVQPSLLTAERAILALLGPAMMPAIRARIEAMPWPDDIGPPAAERPALIAAAEKELAALVAQRDAIRRQAADAGITI